MKYVDYSRLIRKLARHKKDPKGMKINNDEIQLIIEAMKKMKEIQEQLWIEAIIDSVLGE